MSVRIRSDNKKYCLVNYSYKLLLGTGARSSLVCPSRGTSRGVVSGVTTLTLSLSSELLLNYLSCEHVSHPVQFVLITSGRHYTPRLSHILPDNITGTLITSLLFIN